LRGIIKWLGFRQCAIDYFPGQRFSGETKYTNRKMLKFALQGITSFSDKPLYVSIVLGILFFVLSMSYIPYILWCFLNGHTVPGWASIVITIMFFGGLQMLLLGIIGVYIGKIFLQTKQRPAYVVSKTNV
jgi:dolichol-phosphate mannosyltransferase